MGLWNRGSIDDCPPDHFTDCRNNGYTFGVETRDKLSEFMAEADIIRMQLYKPLPPFAGTNIPRIIALTSAGVLRDVLLGIDLYTNVDMLDFALVNFFGRCYISPSNGKTGLSGVNIYVYDGSGVGAFREAGGAAPTVPLTLHWSSAGGGVTDVGTYLVSYAFETASGFITKPCVPFVGIESFGSGKIYIDTLPTGPVGTAARWLIITKLFPLASIGPLGGPWNVERALFAPLFFVLRVANNIDTTAELDFTDESLVDDASYLLRQLETIPSGVGLTDYKGRMVSYGEYDNPSLTRVSEIGEPEAFSATSGFIISDPSDSTGIRSATVFNDLLYLYRRSRGRVTQDNGGSASTWDVNDFEKSAGTEQYGIAAVLDAKGSTSSGFILASLGALYYFNGTMVEPELSYKIKNLWDRINQEFFHLVQVCMNPVTKYLYILVPLDGAEEVTHIIWGDYSDGLDAKNIRWSIWEFEQGITSILGYQDFAGDVPTTVVRVSTEDKIMNLGSEGTSDDGEEIDSWFELAPVRYGIGLSQFDRIRLRGLGPATLELIAYGMDKQSSYTPVPIVIPSATPGREYAQLMNLMSEHCRLKVRCANLNELYVITAIILEGTTAYGERPR